MCRRVALRSSLRITLVLLIGVALLPAPFVSMLVAATKTRAPILANSDYYDREVMKHFGPK